MGRNPPPAKSGSTLQPCQRYKATTIYGTDATWPTITRFQGIKLAPSSRSLLTLQLHTQQAVLLVFPPPPYFVIQFLHKYTRTP